ncbi:MAG: hypothetical protein IJD18_03175 [Clostridia bacterium]|nr:hypothetical protein [Clostridia bacterium]
MTKNTSIILLSIFTALILFVSVFSFLPGGLQYGQYNEYNSPSSLIQLGADLGQSVKGVYNVELVEDDETSTLENVQKVLNNRLGSVYSYYNTPISAEGSVLEISIPKTSNKENSSAEAILNAVGSNGVVEILTTQSSSYSAENVLMSYAEGHFKNASTSRYVNGDQVFYIVKITLTKDGQKVASESLSSFASNWSAYCSVDQVVSYGVVYSSTDKTLQVYTNSQLQADTLKSFVKFGSLNATLTLNETLDVESNNLSAIIFLVVLAVVVLASWALFYVRYRVLGIAGIFSSAIAVLAFVLFGGLVYYSVFNLFGAIAVILGYCGFVYLTMRAFDGIQALLADGKSYQSAKQMGFAQQNILNLIVHGALLVLGIILWLIPTAVTVGLGNALVYVAVLSFVATMGLNRMFATIVRPLGEENVANFGINK